MRQNVCAAVGAERGGGLLLLDADLVEHRHDLADHQGQRDEQVASTMPGTAKMTWNPTPSSAPPNQPFWP